VVLCAAAVLAAVSTPVCAGADRPSRDDVEAAYLYNFGRFVRWPDAGDQGPLRICVAGPDAFSRSVARLAAGERVGDRPLTAIRIERTEDELRCSILFISAAEQTRLGAWLGQAAGKPILTVGEASDFMDRGGIIQFVAEDNHVRFSVNLNAAGRSGLSLSSELLKVAVSVVGSSANGGAR
jgi:hypothetical protein